MRILMMNYEYPPLGGGGGVAQQDVARALAARHDVAVLTTHFRGLPREERVRGVRVRRIPVWGRTNLATATIRSMVTFAPAACAAGLPFLRAFRPDILDAYFAVPSGLPAVILGRLTRTPVVLTLVGGDVFDPDPTAGVAPHRNPLVRAVVRRVIRAADARVAISEDTRRRALLYHAAPSDTEVIPLGLVPPPFPVAPGPRRGAGEAFRLITVGRLIPRKAHEDLFRALALLGRRDIHLDLVGAGPLETALRRSAANLGVGDLVTFHGAVSETEKWRLLAQANCFVSASLYEGFGMVFLEAMHAGLPVVTTDRGGQTDILRTGEHALFVPPREPAQLAAALAWIMRDAALRVSLAQANRERVRQFLIEQTAARYEALFERVLARRRREERPVRFAGQLVRDQPVRGRGEQ